VLPRDDWYIACASSRLGRRRPVAARVLDRDLALFRDERGRAHALLDRCCHRGVRLSLGRVEGGRLACGYHGWRFDGDGRCTHIPSLVDARRIPDRCGVPSVPCAEHDGYVWTWAGEPHDTPPTPPRPIRGFVQKRWRQGQVSLRCDALRAVENNLDWCHPAFVHRWAHPQFFMNLVHGPRDHQYEVRITEHGLMAFAPATTTADEPPPARRYVTLEFELPNRVVVEFGRNQSIVMHFVPTGPNTCRMEWLVSRVLPFGPRVAWHDGEPRIFAQDRRLLESAQPAHDTDGDEFERSVEADASTLLVRKVVALAARNEWHTGRAALAPRRVVRVRA
jgi:phenylpropionate dioxygenase-like ring-hydroxylating dioxygenase large terminal subunit